MAATTDSMERVDAARDPRSAVRAIRERAWRRVQAASGLVFLAFAALHVANQWLALGGPEAYDGFQRAARAVYQNPVLEVALVMAPLGVHVIAAVRRMALRGLYVRGGSWRMRLHRITGYALLAVIFGHIAAVRGPSLLLDVLPGFAGVSFSLWWMPAVFYVYYTIFGASALYHGLKGMLLALHALGWRRDASLPGGRFVLVAPVAVGTMLIVLALLAFGGLLFPIADPTDNAYARMWNERFGVELRR